MLAFPLAFLSAGRWTFSSLSVLISSLCVSALADGSRLRGEGRRSAPQPGRRGLRCCGALQGGGGAPGRGHQRPAAAVPAVTTKNVPRLLSLGGELPAAEDRRPKLRAFPCGCDLGGVSEACGVTRSLPSGPHRCAVPSSRLGEKGLERRRLQRTAVASWGAHANGEHRKTLEGPACYGRRGTAGQVAGRRAVQRRGRRTNGGEHVSRDGRAPRPGAGSWGHSRGETDMSVERKSRLHLLLIPKKGEECSRWTCAEGGQGPLGSRATL